MAKQANGVASLRVHSGTNNVGQISADFVEAAANQEVSNFAKNTQTTVLLNDADQPVSGIEPTETEPFITSADPESNTAAWRLRAESWLSKKSRAIRQLHLWTYLTTRLSLFFLIALSISLYMSGVADLQVAIILMSSFNDLRASGSLVAAFWDSWLYLRNLSKLSWEDIIAAGNDVGINYINVGIRICAFSCAMAGIGLAATILGIFAATLGFIGAVIELVFALRNFSRVSERWRDWLQKEWETESSGLSSALQADIERLTKNNPTDKTVIIELTWLQKRLHRPEFLANISENARRALSPATRKIIETYENERQKQLNAEARLTFAYKMLVFCGLSLIAAGTAFIPGGQAISYVFLVSAALVLMEAGIQKFNHDRRNLKREKLAATLAAEDPQDHANKLQFSNINSFGKAAKLIKNNEDHTLTRQRSGPSTPIATPVEGKPMTFDIKKISNTDKTPLQRNSLYRPETKQDAHKDQVEHCAGKILGM